jgi:hypothetical protein
MHEQIMYVQSERQTLFLISQGKPKDTLEPNHQTKDYRYPTSTTFTSVIQLVERWQIIHAFILDTSLLTIITERR